MVPCKPVIDRVEDGALVDKIGALSFSAFFTSYICVCELKKKPFLAI